MTNPDTIARGIIERWRPYMKVFGPNKGFPKNKISMIEEIAAALREYGVHEYRRGYNDGFHDGLGSTADNDAEIAIEIQRNQEGGK